MSAINNKPVNVKAEIKKVRRDEKDALIKADAEARRALKDAAETREREIASAKETETRTLQEMKKQFDSSLKNIRETNRNRLDEIHRTMLDTVNEARNLEKRTIREAHDEEAAKIAGADKHTEQKIKHETLKKIQKSRYDTEKTIDDALFEEKHARQKFLDIAYRDIVKEEELQKRTRVRTIISAQNTRIKAINDADIHYRNTVGEVRKNYRSHLADIKKQAEQDIKSIKKGTPISERENSALTADFENTQQENVHSSLEATNSSIIEEQTVLNETETELCPISEEKEDAPIEEDVVGPETITRVFEVAEEQSIPHEDVTTVDIDEQQANEAINEPQEVMPVADKEDLAESVEVFKTGMIAPVLMTDEAKTGEDAVQAENPVAEVKMEEEPFSVASVEELEKVMPEPVEKTGEVQTEDILTQAFEPVTTYKEAEAVNESINKPVDEVENFQAEEPIAEEGNADTFSIESTDETQSVMPEDTFKETREEEGLIQTEESIAEEVKEDVSVTVESLEEKQTIINEPVNTTEEAKNDEVFAHTDDNIITEEKAETLTVLANEVRDEVINYKETSLKSKEVLFSGIVRIAVKSPADSHRIKLLGDELNKIDKVRMLFIGGEVNKDTVIHVKLDEEMPLADKLKILPDVSYVSIKDKNIQVTLKTDK